MPSFPPPRRPPPQPRPSSEVEAETPPPDSVGAWELSDDAGPTREEAFADALRLYRSLLVLTLFVPIAVLLFTQAAATAVVVAVGLALDAPLFAVLLAFVAVHALVLLGVAFSSNWTALWGNQRLARAIEEAVVKQSGQRGGWFVGVVDPAKKTVGNQLIDTHEDIGLLFVEPDALIFEGMRSRIRVDRANVRDLASPRIWQFSLQKATWCEVVHAEGALRFESRRLATVRLNGEDTRKLRATIEAWRAARLG